MIDVQSIKTGSLPGFVPLQGMVTFISEDAKTLELSVNLTSVSITDGQAQLQGAPWREPALYPIYRGSRAGSALGPVTAPAGCSGCG